MRVTSEKGYIKNIRKEITEPKIKGIDRNIKIVAESIVFPSLAASSAMYSWFVAPLYIIFFPDSP